MRIIQILLGLIIILAAPFSVAADLPADGRAGIVNLSDGHCAPCKIMERISDKMEREYKDDLYSITINPLKDKEAAEKYGAKTLPTIIFFDRSGKEVLRHAGVVDEDTVRAVVEGMIFE